MVVATSPRRWPRAARCWSTSLGEAPLRMHVRAYEAKKIAASPSGMSTIIANVRSAGPRGDDAHDACRTRAPAHMNLAVRNRPLVPIRTRARLQVQQRARRFCTGAWLATPLHLHLYKPPLLPQHALGLLLWGLKKQVHVGLQNRSVRRLRPASRTAMTATTQSPAIATKFSFAQKLSKSSTTPLPALSLSFFTE